MNHRYSKLQIGPNTYEYQRFGKVGQRPLFFLPGFSMMPHEHRRLFKRLEDRFRVVSVKLIGVNYLEEQPVTIHQVSEKIADLCEAFFPGGGFIAAGHSTGAIAELYAASNGFIKPDGLCLWSPVTRTNQTLVQLLREAVHLGIDEIFHKGSAKFGLKHGLHLAAEYFRHLPNNLSITRDIAHFDYWDSREKLNAPACVTYAGKDEFGFVPNNYDLGRMASFFSTPSHLHVKVHQDYRHLWILDHPAVAAIDLDLFLVGRDGNRRPATAGNGGRNALRAYLH